MKSRYNFIEHNITPSPIEYSIKYDFVEQKRFNSISFGYG